MIELNNYFLFAIVMILGVYLLDVVSNWLNLGALSAQLPDGLRETFDHQEYAKSQEYTRVRTNFDFVGDAFSLAVLLGFWWLGGFQWLDAWVRSAVPDDRPILQGLLYIGALVFGSTLLSIPFSIYSTFVIEEKFGFNRMTWVTYLADTGKELLLTLLLGGLLLAGILWVFQQWGAQAWIPAWLLTTSVSLGLSYVAPQWILPLFNKFEPLPDGELKDAIHQMAERCHFPLKEVFQIDGSRRSTKTNAFFTGFGKNKRIALYDTLIQRHTVPELVAILAHEIGHYRKRHIVQRMVIAIVEMGILFFLLGLFLENRQLFAAFGVQQVSVYGSLVFFSLLLSPTRRVLNIALMVLSRRHEFEADAYAAEVTGNVHDLGQGLKKLAQENLSNLTPHPFFVWLNYSHPPMLERLAALENHSPATSSTEEGGRKQ